MSPRLVAPTLEDSQTLAGSELPSPICLVVITSATAWDPTGEHVLSGCLLSGWVVGWLAPAPN